jgi:multiple sugar transport system substrate-binding protein
VLAQAAGGVGADVYLFETKQMQAFAARKFFLPLDDYVAGSSVIKKDVYFAADWEEMYWSGHQMLVPFDNSPAMIWYNKELFDQAGVTYPPNTYGAWKWADFLSMAQQLTKGEGAQRVFGWAGERNWPYLLNWIWSNGGMLLNEQKTECLIDMPETVQALQWAADLAQKHKVQPLAADLGENGNAGLFFAKRVALAQKGTWWAIDLKAQQGLKWNVAPMPDGAAGAFVRNPLDAWGIWSGSKNPDAAWQFIEFLSQDESLKELTKAGLSVSKRAVMMSDVFLKQQPADVDWRLFVDALDGHTKPHPDTAIYPEMNNLLQPEWDAVLDGASTVEAMVKKVKDPINQLLADCIKKGNCVAAG